jgi:predicted secreted protein
MFTDKRSKRVVLVAHCLLNQNAKIDRCAHFGGAVPDILAPLASAGIGLIQLPCPEMLVLGLDRGAHPMRPATIEQEDTRVATAMQDAESIQACRELAIQYVDQVAQYQRHGFTVLGIVGVNGSPTCGVETNWANDEEPFGPGVFMRELSSMLAENGISLPMRGVKVYQPEALRRTITELIGA